MAYRVAQLRILAANAQLPKLKEVATEYADLITRLAVGFGPKWRQEPQSAADRMAGINPGHWECLCCLERTFDGDDQTSDKIPHKGDCIWADMERRWNGGQ